MKNKGRFSILLFVIFCLIYYLRFKANDKNETFPNKNYLIEGRISSINKIQDSSWQVKVGDFWVQSTEKPQFRVGERIQAIGRIETKVINNFYRQFWLINPEIQKIEATGDEGLSMFSVYWLFLRKITDLRLRSERIYERLLPQPESSLLSGIVLGSQSQLSPGFYEQLRRSGTLHIVVASGMNITILGKVVLEILLKKWSRGVALIGSLFCILIYTFLAGTQPPIVRATIMGGVAFIGQVLGRQYWAAWSLFMASALMLLVSPQLLFEIGFQLSVAATAGLVFLSPKIGESIQKLSFIRLIKPFQSDLVETLAAQAAVLPLLLTYFGQFNLFSFIPNLLIAPLIPLLMRLGGLLLVVGFFFQALAQILAWLVWVPLRYLVLVIEFFGQIQWLSLEWYWPWWLVIWYWLTLVLSVVSSFKITQNANVKKCNLKLKIKRLKI